MFQYGQIQAKVNSKLLLLLDQEQEFSKIHNIAVYFFAL